MKQDTRLNVTIPTEYKLRLRETAEKRRVSMSQAIREAIAVWCLADDTERTNRDADFQIQILMAKKKPR